jgi:hypothetical protein
MEQSEFSFGDERFVKRLLVFSMVGWAIALFAVGFGIGVLT